MSYWIGTFIESADLAPDSSSGAPRPCQNSPIRQFLYLDAPSGPKKPDCLDLFSQDHLNGLV